MTLIQPCSVLISRPPRFRWGNRQPHARHAHLHIWAPTLTATEGAHIQGKSQLPPPYLLGAPITPLLKAERLLFTLDRVSDAVLLVYADSDPYPMHSHASLSGNKRTREKRVKQEKLKACHLLINVQGDAKTLGTGGNYHLTADPLSMANFLRCLHMSHTEVQRTDQWLIDTPEALKYRTDYQIRAHSATLSPTEQGLATDASPSQVSTSAPDSTPQTLLVQIGPIDYTSKRTHELGH